MRVEVIGIMGAGTCSSGLHEVGQSWVVDDAVVPQGMCGYAYNAINPFIMALRCGGRFPWKDEPVATVCCPDADNPVVFRLSLDE
ncbi:MAG: TIGR04076 family protein [Gemmatimonas sp.]|nr:TIGR04076 family protein [Gemmatimonas sp.]